MADKIVLLTFPKDQGDLIQDYLDWHLALGVDLILAQDCGSDDNTHQVLNRYSRNGRVSWFPIPVKNYLHYRPAETMAQIATEQHGADWIIMADVDEFLCLQGDLKAILGNVETNITSLSIPCFNMTGTAPLSSGQKATMKQTLRIDRSVTPTYEQMHFGDLPEPYIFIQHPPKTIVRATAFTEYGPGAHDVKTSWGEASAASEIRFLHFPIRGFDKFEKKVKNVTAFFEANQHYEPWWGWHWRRWIQIDQAGRLREEYEKQFVSAARAEELVSQGICSIDRTIADWIDNKNQSVIYRLNNWGPMARLRRFFG